MRNTPRFDRKSLQAKRPGVIRGEVWTVPARRRVVVPNRRGCTRVGIAWNCISSFYCLILTFVIFEVDSC